MNYLGELFSPLFSDLCGLCVFAGDNPSFGCGSAALGLRGENSFTVNPKNRKNLKGTCPCREILFHPLMAARVVLQRESLCLGPVSDFTRIGAGA